MNINKTGTTLLGLGLAATLGLAACSTSDSTATTPAASESAAPSASASETAANTIPEVAAQAGNFTVLVDALTAAGLVETLSSGEYTVFAPTDDAFQPLVDNGTVTELLKDPEGQLTQILLYHVVEGKVTAEQVLQMNGQKVKTVQGEELTVNVKDGSKVSLTDAAGNTINVVATDVNASNGVIHAIDGVLMPTS